MTSGQAIELFWNLLQVAIFVTGPVLAASLLAGVLVGVIQAATQINEASVSFIAKATAVMAVLLTIGPALVARVVAYAQTSLEAIEHVVH